MPCRAARGPGWSASPFRMSACPARTITAFSRGVMRSGGAVRGFKPEKLLTEYVSFHATRTQCL
eukprot:6950940-Prorocentrum_lima.AAC.1